MDVPPSGFSVPVVKVTIALQDHTCSSAGFTRLHHDGQRLQICPTPPCEWNESDETGDARCTYLKTTTYAEREVPYQKASVPEKHSQRNKGAMFLLHKVSLLKHGCFAGMRESIGGERSALKHACHLDSQVGLAGIQRF